VSGRERVEGDGIKMGGAIFLFVFGRYIAIPQEVVSGVYNIEMLVYTARETLKMIF
jgi:hypothetical protein